MAVQVKIPSLGESVTEAVLGSWLAQEGQTVAVDEVIFELESDKANMEIAAEVAGQLHILKQEGDTVSEGDVVAEIDPAAASAKPDTPSPSQASGDQGGQRGASSTCGPGRESTAGEFERVVGSRTLPQPGRPSDRKGRKPRSGNHPRNRSRQPHHQGRRAASRRSRADKPGTDRQTPGRKSCFERSGRTAWRDTGAHEPYASGDRQTDGRIATNRSDPHHL